MDSLRERVAKAIAYTGDGMGDRYPNPNEHWNTVWDGNRSMFREEADAAIAAFEAVLLSDEVVESAAIEIHAEGWNGGKEWADVHPVEQDNYKQQARAALQAALAAAKGTEGSE